MNLRHEVFVRYDPADLRSVRLYDAATDKFMFEWQIADVLMLNYLESVQENVADAQERIRMTKKFAHEQAAGITANLSNDQRMTLIEMTVNKAEKNRTDKFRIQRDDIKKLFPILESENKEKEIDFLFQIAQTQQALRGTVNLFSNAYDNKNYSYNGLVAMAKFMDIEI